jgi:hypothetical protein
MPSSAVHSETDKVHLHPPRSEKNTVQSFDLLLVYTSSALSFAASNRNELELQTTAPNPRPAFP